VREAPTEKQLMTARAAKAPPIKSRCYKDGDPATADPPPKVPRHIAISPIHEQDKGGDTGKKGKHNETKKQVPTVKVAPCALEFKAGLHGRRSS
jgi:hypothetical protein